MTEREQQLGELYVRSSSHAIQLAFGWPNGRLWHTAIFVPGGQPFGLPGVHRAEGES